MADCRLSQTARRAAASTNSTRQAKAPLSTRVAPPVSAAAAGPVDEDAALNITNPIRASDALPRNDIFQLRRWERWLVLRLDSESDSPAQTGPADAGSSQAGRSSNGWMTATHIQLPSVRLDHMGNLSSTS